MEELEKLANSVEEFTTCLIDPLKSDTKDREAFGDSLDLIIDKAIEYNQGKVTVNPNLQLSKALALRTIEKDDKNASKPVARHSLICRIILSNV